MDYVQIVLDQDWGLVGIVPPQNSPPQVSPLQKSSSELSPYQNSLSGSDSVNEGLAVSSLRTENPRWDYARNAPKTSLEGPRLADSSAAVILNPPSRKILRPAVTSPHPIITPISPALPLPDPFAGPYPGLSSRSNPQPLKHFGSEVEPTFTPVYGLGAPLLATGNLLYVPGEEMSIPNLLSLQHKDNILTGFGL